MPQTLKSIRSSRFLVLLLALAAVFFLASLPAMAISTEILRMPTADVLPFGRLALEAGYPFDSTVQRATIGLPHGFQLAAAVPPGGSYAEGVTADLRYRLVEGTLVTPAAAVGTTFNTKTNAFAPYAVLTKGILNAKFTAGVHLDELTALRQGDNPVFAGVDLDVFGPLHALAEYEDGALRYGAKLSLLNAEVKAYLEGNKVNLLGRLVLPF
ncbi:MAG TPA: hypothetical protein GXX28_01580 [Firmicutes bacterium]|nr:hypothetical protein [Bacillota bacterium]